MKNSYYYPATSCFPDKISLAKNAKLSKYDQKIFENKFLCDLCARLGVARLWLASMSRRSGRSLAEGWAFGEAWAFARDNVLVAALPGSVKKYPD